MKLIILPEFKAIELAKVIEEKTSIISITTPPEENVKFDNNPNIVSILNLKFYDCINDLIIEDDTLIKAPIQEDFNGLKNFVDSLSCDTLIVHCGAGYSRSAAVAAAINEYLNLGYKIFGDNNYSPNPTVYNLCLNEFGIQKTNEYYEDVFR